MELTGLETEPASLEPALDAVCTRAPVHEKQMKVLYQGFAFIKGGVLSKLEGELWDWKTVCQLHLNGFANRSKAVANPESFPEAPGYASKMA